VIEKSILSVLYLKKSLQTLSIRNNFVNDEFEEIRQQKSLRLPEF